MGTTTPARSRSACELEDSPSGLQPAPSRKRTTAYPNKLAKHNNREWFEANRDLYNSDFLEPCIQFILEMGDKLQYIDTDIVAIPKVDKSIFRLHRDVRFSKDKTPYKTNAGLYFWNGKMKEDGCKRILLSSRAETFWSWSWYLYVPSSTLKTIS